MEIRKELMKKAFDNVFSSIDENMLLPIRVFRKELSSVLFFESDCLFSEGFSDFAKKIMEIENSKIICIVNFSETKDNEYESASMLFLDQSIDKNSYLSLLKEGGPEKGWMFSMDRYGIASDSGEWAIYCEKGNDVSAIAFRNPENLKKYVECVKLFHAESVVDLMKNWADAAFPFNSMTEEWRQGLIQHYGNP